MHSPAATGSKRPPVCRPVVLAIPAAAFCLGIAAAIVTACSRPSPYCGVYRQETVEVAAKVSGTIVALMSEHGAAVKPGDSLVTLDCTVEADRKRELTARRAELQRQLDEANARAAVETAMRVDALEKERLDTRLQFADLLQSQFDVQLRIEALRRSAEQRRVVRNADSALQTVAIETESSGPAVRQREFSEAVNHEQVLSTKIALCEERLARIETLKADIASQTELSLGIERLQAAVDEVDRSLAAVANDQDRATVDSPAYGRIGVYRRNVGDFVSAGETLVEVFDAERPYILLTVPVGELAELTPGRKVEVEFDGIETRKALKGVVAEVVSEAERNADAARAPGTVVAQIRVCPVGRLWPTPPPGATAYVHLETETRHADAVNRKAEH